jgi:hypothetical protein
MEGCISIALLVLALRIIRIISVIILSRANAFRYIVLIEKLIDQAHYRHLVRGPVQCDSIDDVFDPLEALLVLVWQLQLTKRVSPKFDDFHNDLLSCVYGFSGALVHSYCTYTRRFKKR